MTSRMFSPAGLYVNLPGAEKRENVVAEIRTANIQSNKLQSLS
jgi:hypothetical protein